MKATYLGLCSLLLHTSCDALWHSFRVQNARACEQASADACGPGMFCDLVLNECVVDSAISPSITNASPALGPTSGGTVITLDGANFVTGATVQVGGGAATPATVLSSSRITFTLPANPGVLGAVPIVVSNPDGHQGSRADLFAYYLAEIGFGTMATYPSGADGPYIIGIGDFNSDGKSDIAAVHSPGISLNTLIGDGTGRFTAGKSSMLSGGAQGLAIADFNLDGRTDIVVAATDIFVYLGKSGGALDNPALFKGGNGPVSIVAGDFNSDGKPDLATAARGGGAAAVLIGNGLGGFATPVLYSLSATADPLAIVTADFNRDTRLDLAVADPTDGAVHILLADSQGSFAPPTHFVTGRDQRGLAVGDA